MANLWTLEQLKHLKDLEASVTPTGTIHIIPISKGGLDEGYGSNLMWESRLYRKGLMGPLPVDADTLQAVGLSAEEAADWAARTDKAVTTLNRLYPVLVAGIAEKVEEIEAAIPAALPAGVS
ncbi:hypothetical protein ES703_52986 [subsurface metagenome]